MTWFSPTVNITVHWYAYQRIHGIPRLINVQQSLSYLKNIFCIELGHIKIVLRRKRIETNSSS